MSPSAPRRRPERRATDPLATVLESILDGQDHARESLHELRNAATVLNLRTERIEQEQKAVAAALDVAEGSPMGRALVLVGRDHDGRLTKVEATLDTHAVFITQLKTGIGLVKLLAGGSLLGTGATLGKVFGWW